MTPFIVDTNQLLSIGDIVGKRTLDTRLRETLTLSIHGLFPAWIKAILSRSNPEGNFLDETVSIDHRYPGDISCFVFATVSSFLCAIKKKKNKKQYQ